ncbi:F-box domain protein [Talaromyces stipitatus ATCC 10500]|uniref:F-box domain protein n=1 Tax=Talaromyces stipitatus (strain ATCC 10500 / CBS 375.48 / QM 6759 / NRRL 1006) TaxID=441959 RepID=B8M6X0_TALSN|nr:F-box domain protein [Talaromyces stipitatus ATCC 10500]EED20190.1 F-box domain protein [Talaromyces stipitatus ATCC 10500]
MKIIPGMLSTTRTEPIYIPTEIILQIVSRLDRSLRGQERQRTLYNICLVSHQWYSVALSFLYSRPRLEKGNAYRKFTDVLCPPAGLPKTSKDYKDLGGLVRRLNLSRLVHHSSNSMTARLIGRVRENLEVFIAPAAGFSVNCLSPLSKCTNLRYLDLSLVHEPLSFESIIKSIRSMKRLITFRSPASMRITHEPFSKHTEYPKWPPNLTTLQLSGTIETSSMDTFHWPENITQLCLKNCLTLSLEVMTAILSNPQLGTKLKRLTISTYNRGLQPECIHLIPAFLPNLVFLSIPGDLVQDMFFSMIAYQCTELALEVLELGHTHTGERFDFEIQSLIDLLDSKLPYLRAVGFHTMYGEYPDLDDALLERAEERGNDLRVSEETEEFDVGTYYFD